MKDFKKRWQPNGVDSVIGKLMGLEQLRPQQQVGRIHRGLSDNYVRRAASLGLRPRSLVYIGRSSGENNDKVREKCISSSISKVGMGIRSPKPAGASVSKSLSGAIYEDKRSLEEHCALGNVLRSLQKLEHDSVGVHLSELRIDRMDTSLQLKSAKETHGLENVKSTQHFGSVYGGHREVLRPKSGKHQHEKAHKELVVNGIVSPRHSCRACSRTMNRILGQERLRSKFEEVLRPYMGDNYSVNEVETLVHSGPGVNDFTNYSHEQSLKAANKVQEVGVSHKGQTRDEMFALAYKKSMPRNLNGRLHRNGLCRVSNLHSRSLGSSSSSVLSRMYVSEDNYLKSSSGSDFEATNKILSSALTLKQDGCTASDNKSKEQTISEKDILEPKGGRGYEQSIWDEIAKGSENDGSNLADQYLNDYAYANTDAFDLEASLNEFSEEESVSSNLKKANQHSPNSVLEPFDVQSSSAFEYFDSIDLKLQLQALNFEAEETYSEGSAMLISDDEDNEEPFDDLAHNGRKVKRWLGDYESRNFSYMVDVLDEAGYCGTKSFINLKKCHSLDCPMSPLVFETLEKKYGKQTSWQKSERQLLFDRINSGLLDIFNSIMNIHASEMPIRRWICFALRRDEVEDELWMALIRQENEKSKDLSEKAIGKWLEYEEGVNIICRDLETSLFDELVMELASLWD